MRRVPRQPLHADFRAALRASGYSLATLAALAGIAVRQNLWTFLHERVPVSRLNVERLRTLAVAVNYDGPVFEGDGPFLTHTRSTVRDARNA